MRHCKVKRHDAPLTELHEGHVGIGYACTQPLGFDE
jgi:hypothetical protein